MRKAILTICLLLFILPAYAENNIEGILENIFSKHQATKQDRSEARLQLLVELDRELRILIEKPWTVQNKTIAQRYWKGKYTDIGVSVGQYSDALAYSGKLLADAKALDAKGQYAAYTSYVNICGGVGNFSGSCDMPDIKAALDYEKKFPQGPFIEDTLTMIGNFYSDLRQALKISDTKDFKYQCFSKYINERLIQSQIADASKSAAKYYKKVLALHSDKTAANDSIKGWLDEIDSNAEDTGWHFCAD